MRILGLYNLVNASPKEAREQLDDRLDDDPVAAAQLTLQALVWLQGRDGRKELRSVVADAARKAIAKLEGSGS